MGASATCQLCLRPIPYPRGSATVQGPFLCEECLSLANGGDFGPVEPEF